MLHFTYTPRTDTKAILSFAALCLLILAAFASSARAVELKGYYKNLLTASKTAGGEAYTSDLNRLRLELVANPAPGLSVHLAWDNELVTGDVLSTAAFIAAKDAPEETAADLSATFIDAPDLWWGHSVYRAYAKYSRGRVTITAGRQRIALGTGRVWNPTDLINPLTPIDVEGAERQGVDAVRLDVATGPLSAVTVVHSPGRESSGDVSFARASTNISGYDLSAMAGSFRRDVVVGADFSGYIRDSGFRGEFTYTDRDSGGGGFARAVLSFDHTFESSLYVLLEYLYNGGNDPGLSSPLLASGTSEITTRNRNFVAIGTGYDITPLVRFDSVIVYDVDGRSVLAAPAITYNIRDDIDLSAGVQVFGASGSGRGEYGSTPTLFHAGVTAYF